MSSSNLVKISSIEETVYGVTPAAGEFKTVRYTSESLSGTPQTAESAEIQSDRTSGGQVQVGLDVGGDINAELSSDAALKDFIRGAMMQKTWEPTTEDAGTWTVDPIDKTFTNDTSSVEFAIGDLIIVSGATDAKNNGPMYVKNFTSTENTPAVLKAKITATPGANPLQYVFDIDSGVAGTFSYGDADDTEETITAGASGGFTYAAAANYTVTFTDENSVVSTLALPAVDTDPVVVVGADEILTPAINTVVLTVAKETIATADETMTLKKAEKLSIGTDTISFSIEKDFTDLSDKAIAYRGMVVNQMNLSMTYGSIVESSFMFMGNGYDTPTPKMTSGRTIQDAGTTQPFNASSDIGLVIVDGKVADFCIQSLQISLSNGLTPQTCMGTLAPRQYSLGMAAITVSGSAYLSDENWGMMAKKLSQTPVSIAFTVQNDDGGMAVVLHGAQLSFPDPSSGGMDQQVSIEFSGSAKQVAAGYFDLYMF
jgi:hypothetical protein